MRLSSALLPAALLASALGAAAHPSPTRVEVAPGVHLFRTEPYGDVGLDGNSVALVGEDGVLVFDANGTPAAAAAVLAEIRKLTTAPVRYLVYSHWHWDHWYGAEVYRKAFPQLVVIAHEQTRQLMAGPALEFNRPGLERDLPGYLAALETRLDAARQTGEDTTALRHRVEDVRFFLDQKRMASLVLPTLTFKTGLSLYLGTREIRVLHIDPR